MFGAAWYYQPGYWPTRDGVIPYRWFWHEFAALSAVQALRKHEMAAAIKLAFAEPDDPARDRNADAIYGGGRDG